MDFISLAQPTLTADYSVLMAIVDFLPVLFYFLAAWLVTKDLYPHVGKTTYALLSAGCYMVFIGGAFKALWKLLFCFGINYPVLFTSFFPMQGPGFCLYFAGLIMAFKGIKKDGAALNAVTATTMIASTPLLALQSIGSIGSLVALAVMGFKRKSAIAGIYFILSLIFLLGMVGLSIAIDSSLGWANWLEQGVNTVGQVFFFLGALKMHKVGYKAGA
ncbi:MAG: hypothetical protein MJ111_00725 [Clostridia bacterium]|nr:hypothetical protein [Candidatus Limimonas egerieequi]MCQ2489070.1 hypothetical protein [Clostridia bacterium]